MIDVVEVDHVSEEHLADLQTLYGTTGWAADRDREGIRRMLEHTDVVVGLVRVDIDPTVLVGFARVLTDYEYRAFIEDVVVAVPYRNRGLGRRLVETVCGRPELEAVEEFVLECRADLVGFYRALGFEIVPSEARLMKRERDWAADPADRTSRHR